MLFDTKHQPLKNNDLRNNDLDAHNYAIEYNTTDHWKRRVALTDKSYREQPKNLKIQQAWERFYYEGILRMLIFYRITQDQDLSGDQIRIK